jgi:ATP-dependent Zn protease
MDSRRRNTVHLVLLAGLLAVIWASYRTVVGTSNTPEKSLSELLTAVDEKEVASGTFTSEGDRVDWVDTKGRDYRTFITAGYAATLVEKFHANGVPFGVTPSSSSNLVLSVILPNVILLAVIGGFMWYMLRRTQRMTRSG